MPLYKFIYKENSTMKNQTIEAADIEEGGSLALQFCREQNFKYLDICPAVFDIKAYLAESNDGKVFLGNPNVFGKNLERRRLAPAQEKEEPVLELGEKEKIPGIPGMPKK